MKIEWINQNDNKPEAEKEVLLLCKVKNHNYIYKCIGFYVPHGILRDDSNFNWDYECCDEYDEEHGDYLVNPGWYKRIYNWDDYSCVWIEDEVIGWADISDEDEVTEW